MELFWIIVDICNWSDVIKRTNFFLLILGKIPSNYTFSTYAKLSVKLTLGTPWYILAQVPFRGSGLWLFWKCCVRRPPNHCSKLHKKVEPLIGLRLFVQSWKVRLSNFSGYSARLREPTSLRGLWRPVVKIEQMQLRASGEWTYPNANHL